MHYISIYWRYSEEKANREVIYLSSVVELLVLLPTQLETVQNYD